MRGVYALGAELASAASTVAFGATQLQLPDLCHVAVAGADLRRLEQRTMSAGRAGDAEREAGEGEAVEILYAQI